MDWQDISTAPKDGTPILTYRMGEPDSYEINEWFELSNARFVERPDGLFEKVIEKGCSGWTQNAHRATHWMPLPPPPTQKE